MVCVKSLHLVLEEMFLGSQYFCLSMSIGVDRLLGAQHDKGACLVQWCDGMLRIFIRNGITPVLVLFVNLQGCAPACICNYIVHGCVKLKS